MFLFQLKYALQTEVCRKNYTDLTFQSALVTIYRLPNMKHRLIDAKNVERRRKLQTFSVTPITTNRRIFINTKSIVNSSIVECTTMSS